MTFKQYIAWMRSGYQSLLYQHKTLIPLAVDFVTMTVTGITAQGKTITVPLADCQPSHF